MSLRGVPAQPLLAAYPKQRVICGNPACRTILSPAMIAYALGARTVRGNSTGSRTPPLGAALPRHPGLRTRRQRARQRIPGILHLAQRKCWRSAAGDPQTIAAPVAGIARNAFCTRSKKHEVSTNDTYAAGARDSNHADRWLESMWITICPATYLITPIITPGDDLQFQGNTSPFSSGHQSISPATGPWKSPSRTPRGVNGARWCTAFAKAA